MAFHRPNKYGSLKLKNSKDKTKECDTDKNQELPTKDGMVRA